MLLLWLTSNQCAINTPTFLTTERTLQPERYSSFTRHGCVRVPHCAIFPTAASRRSLVVSQSQCGWYPLRPARDRRLGILYLTNYLIPLGLILWQVAKVPPFNLPILCGISHRFQWLSPSISQIPKHYSPVRHSSASKASFQPVTVRLACVKPAASVQSEP